MGAATSAKPSFEESYAEINKIVQSRRSAWTYVSLMEWNDVSAILIERVWKKWDTFNPLRGPLENWVNTLISRALMNLRRDLLLRWSRPCVGGWNAKGKTCVHNLGGDSCEITKSHKQCAECPIYADWKVVREHQLNIKSTVALDNHAQEVSNKPEDFCDVEAIKELVDQQMKANLTMWEYRLYDALYIRHLSPGETGLELQAVVKTWKRLPREDEQWGYQFVLTKQRWFKELMFEVLKREGYDLEAFLNYER